MACHSSRLFATDRSAAILAGTVTGMLAALHAGFRRTGLPEFSIFLIPTGVVLGPVLASRSLQRLFQALLAVVFLLFVYAMTAFPICGREALPLTVWATAGVIGIPYHDSLPWPWQTRALADFFILLVFSDVALVLMRDKRTPELSVMKRAVTAACAIGLAVFLSLALYRLSWAARVTGTFCYPLYSRSELTGALLAYFLIFPVNPWIATAAHDRLLDRFLRCE